MSSCLKGTVKWFNDAKGFGFIVHNSGRDVFVHYSAIQGEGYKTLKDGEEVEYELQEGPKGLHALSVIRVNAPEEPAQPAPSNARVGAIARSPEGLAASIEIERTNEATETVIASLEPEEVRESDPAGEAPNP